MSTEEFRRQQLLTDVNKLTFSVLQEIKKGEERLIEKVLSDLLKFPPKRRHLKKVKKEQPKTVLALVVSFSKISNGTNAKNMIGKNPISVQANANNNPPNNAKNRFLIRFTNIMIFLLI